MSAAGTTSGHRPSMKRTAPARQNTQPPPSMSTRSQSRTSTYQAALRSRSCTASTGFEPSTCMRGGSVEEIPVEHPVHVQEVGLLARVEALALEAARLHAGL